jgi:hypothetical protein
VPVREHNQVSSGNRDFLGFALDLKPPFSTRNRVEASGNSSVHAECPRSPKIGSAVEGAAKEQVRQYVVERILSRELIQTLQFSTGYSITARDGEYSRHKS